MDSLQDSTAKTRFSRSMWFKGDTPAFQVRVTPFHLKRTNDLMKIMKMLIKDCNNQIVVADTLINYSWGGGGGGYPLQYMGSA